MTRTCRRCGQEYSGWFCPRAGVAGRSIAVGSARAVVNGEAGSGARRVDTGRREGGCGGLAHLRFWRGDGG